LKTGENELAGKKQDRAPSRREWTRAHIGLRVKRRSLCCGARGRSDPEIPEIAAAGVAHP
jgi:hypothetical protein